MSNPDDFKPEQIVRGVTSVRNRRYIDSRRSGSTGGATPIEQEYLLNVSQNQTIDVDRLRSREDPRRARFNFPPQLREHSFETNAQQKILPSVKTPAYEEQDSFRLGGFSNFQTPMSSQNERRRINPVFQGSIVRDIQTPSNEYFSKNQQKNYPPLKNQPAINPRANKMLLGSVNKEMLERKLNEVAAVSRDSNQRKQSVFSSERSNQSPRGYLKSGISNETPKAVLNDSLFGEEMQTTSTIEHL